MYLYKINAKTCKPYLLLVIWNDAAHKMWKCVAQCLHQFCELLLVHVPNGSEHTLFGAHPEHALIHFSNAHARKFSCKYRKLINLFILFESCQKHISLSHNYLPSFQMLTKNGSELHCINCTTFSFNGSMFFINH